ncbi:MAG: hypothetical protein ACUZ8O_08355 [Candidatus Anammoxibacter sp.]
MTTIDIVANKLHMKPKELLHESLRTYLDKKLLKIEAEIFSLAKKYVKKLFISGDKHLLNLGAFSDVKIEKPKQFLPYEV